MRFEIYGPFVIPRHQNEVDLSLLKEFWREVEDIDEDKGLSKSVGIYVYSSRHGDNFTPWYVGKTNAVTGFKGEIFQSHKLDHYFAASELKRGVPCIHLIARINPNRRTFSQPSAVAEKEIDMLETIIVGMALQANPDLRNSKKTFFLRNWEIPGLLGRKYVGRREHSVNTLRKSLRIKK